MIGSGKYLGMNVERKMMKGSSEERREGRGEERGSLAAGTVLPVRSTGVHLCCGTVHEYVQSPRPNKVRTGSCRLASLKTKCFEYHGSFYSLCSCFGPPLSTQASVASDSVHLLLLDALHCTVLTLCFRTLIGTRKDS